MNLIELPKADRLGLGEPALAAWVAFLEHWQEERTMAGIDYPPVQQALGKIKQLSADEEAQRLAFVRERALRDERTEIRSAIRQGQAALLERLLTKRFGPLRDEHCARLEAATLEQLEQWSDRMLDAATIAAVFSGQ